MAISISPIFSNSLDQNTILQIVLQIEIENNNGASTDTLETASKFFNTKSDDPIVFETIIVENQGKQKNYLKNEKSILAFHPTVPTPPPNC
ncbi:hypothetical protein BWD42_14580 [Sphingobacterium sp. CZ-UAM]|jgi:hypothetical protein|nr:hypothetical protein BWD42_14580 [Sphingobacterium sp. CZ-UAM]